MRIELSERDKSVVRRVAEYSQLSTKHIKVLDFPNVNEISMYRALKRLEDEKYLRHVGVRAVKHRGGTPPGVWELGPKGYWWMHKERKKQHRIDPHPLHVADMSVTFIGAHRRGDIILEEHKLEKVVDNLRVDMSLVFKVPSLRLIRRYYVEMQENARPEVIKPKIENHHNAYEVDDTEGKYPEVAFVAADEYIKDGIRRLIPADRKRLIKLYTIEEFLAKATSLKAQ